jgi:hypothetical protein
MGADARDDLLAFLRGIEVEVVGSVPAGWRSSLADTGWNDPAAGGQAAVGSVGIAELRSWLGSTTSRSMRKATRAGYGVIVTGVRPGAKQHRCQKRQNGRSAV